MPKTKIVKSIAKALDLQYHPMMSKHLVIGLSGYAGVGKDLFYQKLSEKIDIKRHALADALKSDLRNVIIKDQGIDIMNCTRDEKNIIRPLLVNYGKAMRAESLGRHYIERLSKEILPLKENICITDIRYNFFKNDEVHWLKNELNGCLVYISQYRVDVDEGARIYKQAPNEEEKEHTEFVAKAADYTVDWEYTEDKSTLDIHIYKFIEWLSTWKQTTN